METNYIILIIVLIIILGVVEIFIKLHEINKKIKRLNEFFEHCIALKTKLEEKEDYSTEIFWIMANGDSISKMAKENIYNRPIMELLLSFDNLRYDIYKLETITSKISNNFLRQEENYKRLFIKTRCGLINPFTLFYNGIELIMKYVFGYIITKLNSDFDFDGNGWKYVNIVVSLLSGIITIWQFIISLRS